MEQYSMIFLCRSLSTSIKAKISCWFAADILKLIKAERNSRECNWAENRVSECIIRFCGSIGYKPVDTEYNTK